MGALTLRNSVYFSATVSLLDRARELDLDWDKTDVVCSLIGALKYVEDVEDRHQFWCRLELMTGDPETARRRTELTLAKIERILMRYRKKPT